MTTNETDMDRAARDLVVAQSRKSAGWAEIVLGLNVGLYAAAALREIVRAVLVASGMGESGSLRALLVTLDGLGTPLTVTSVAFLLAGAFTFIPWLKRAHIAASSLRVEGLRFGPDDASSFIIPVINFYRPYQFVRDLHDKLSPHGLPEPAPVPHDQPEGHYRDNAVRPAPPAIPTPAAPVALWWGLWMGQNLVKRAAGSVDPATTVDGFVTQALFFAALNLVAAAAAIAAILVVRRVEARISERARRLAHASVPAAVNAPAA